MVSKPNKKRYKLSEVVAEIRSKHPDIEIETEDGQVFTIPPPQLWSDKATDPKVGAQETGEELMGVDQYAAFKAAGGSYAYLNFVIGKFTEEQKTDLGKSSASSNS